jgi:hypothetical protein
MGAIDLEKKRMLENSAGYETRMLLQTLSTIDQLLTDKKKMAEMYRQSSEEMRTSLDEHMRIIDEQLCRMLNINLK